MFQLRLTFFFGLCFCLAQGARAQTGPSADGSPTPVADVITRGDSIEKAPALAASPHPSAQIT
ncbi:MAG: hypothetical protein M3Y03_00200, partial [Verrucomicrobiota bacterium]|nr:hypothetical protein [Verrucomicrobiota bacterium]